MSQRHEQTEAYIEYLGRFLRDGDAGAMAALRRGGSKPPGHAVEMHRYVLPWVPENASSRLEESYYLTASLFAIWHQGKSAPVWGEGSLGQSYRRLVEKRESASLEGRFRGLLSSGRQELPDPLRHAIRLLSTEEVPVDWARLMGDIQGWEHADGYVQRRWAKDFWRKAAVAA